MKLLRLSNTLTVLRIKKCNFTKNTFTHFNNYLHVIDPTSLRELSISALLFHNIYEAEELDKEFMRFISGIY